MRQFDQKAAHARCTHNREELNKAATCGCFHCLEIYPPHEIKEWTDRGTTAVCAKCGIDSVIPSTPEFPVTAAVLKVMEEYWFSYD